jgi:hypothetical protein
MAMQQAKDLEKQAEKSLDKLEDQIARGDIDSTETNARYLGELRPHTTLTPRLTGLTLLLIVRVCVFSCTTRNEQATSPVSGPS